ncbi:MAG: hypothetical protein COV65_02070 [Nitrosopumilales archaeon CG11_big_fil_rev_8_21_14_0_20_33_24]|nr:MAG: hypothetical protein COV65_02070 [Nitrosopumilales archaeon CG11_big_fil_rev_8_21_14_0_20_33_24]PIY88033.1 MAG: hypothetical protein COY74_10405 [Nitrosopumilales archaeon CG_4_10_14_0_8_um_filter_34_8]
MQKQYLLIPVGVVLMVIGGYIISYSAKPEYFLGRSWMEAQNALLSTDYNIGLMLLSLGFTCFLIIIMWKRKLSQEKSRK